MSERFSPASDVDLLVLFEAGAPVGLFHLIRLQHRLENLLGRPVDLVRRDGLKPGIRERSPSRELNTLAQARDAPGHQPHLDSSRPGLSCP
ncbi:MAG: hypothetical protein CMK00_05275 [Planctomycetes bacterium]|nr:hypothetical protein [Planctomycetota bacterium]